MKIQRLETDFHSLNRYRVAYSKRADVFWWSANVFGARSNLGSAQLKSADAYFNMPRKLREDSKLEMFFCFCFFLWFLYTAFRHKSTNTVFSDLEVEDLVPSVCLKSKQHQPWTSPTVGGQTGVP